MPRKLKNVRKHVRKQVGPVHPVAMEALEPRLLMTATVNYDPDGLGPLDSIITGDPIPALTGLDWSLGNLVSVYDRDLSTGGPQIGDQLTTYYQAKLIAFQDGSSGGTSQLFFGPNGLGALNGAPGNPIAPNNFQWTVVLKVREVVTNSDASGMGFSLVSDPSNYIKVFYDGPAVNQDGSLVGTGPATPADDLAGTGFADGRLILQAGGGSGIGNLRFLGETGDFDQFFGADAPWDVDPYLVDGDQGAYQTDSSSGNLRWNATINFVDPNFIGFSGLVGSSIELMLHDSDRQLPFDTVDPSHRFYDQALNGGLGGLFVPSLGLVNGSIFDVGDNAIQFESDADSSISIVEQQLAALGDYVWHDLDADGIQDANEVGVPNVLVKLLDINDNVLDSQFTDANGLYLFDNLTPGDYKVMFVAPAGYMVSPQDQGADDAKDSDADMVTGMTGVYNLSAGETDLTVDMGLFIKGSLHGYGYEDRDADGNLDATDVAWNVPNVSAKKIDLFKADGVTLVDSMLTDANGQFWFVGLTPGTYVLKEDLSVFATDTHVMASPDPDGPGGVPGGADARTVTILSGEELVYTDGAAMLPPGDLRHEVLTDDGRLVFGNFLKGSIHGYGFEDTDADGNLDANEGAWNVTGHAKKIDLLDADGNFITSTTTDSNGQFWFLGLAPGTYMLQEDISIYDPNHIMPSPDPDGPGGVPGGAEKRTVTILSGQELVYEDGAAMGMLKDGQEEVLVDDGRLIFGNFLKGSIHGFGYEDLDADGNLDATDVAWNVPNVSPKKIDLFAADGTTLLDSTLTDANGQFWFTELMPGTYVLKEDLSVFASDPHVMASPDPDGPGGVPGGAAARTVTVLSGQELVYENGATMGMLKDGQEEVLVDDGRLVFGNFLKGSIHPFGFEDKDADGVYEPNDGDIPYENKPLELRDSNGNAIDFMWTDAAGQAWFLNLTPGTYTVVERIDLLPPGVQPSTPISRTVTVLSGQELVWADGATMGMLKDGQEEVNVGDQLMFGNTRLAKLGDFVWHDLDADGQQDANEPGIPGATVHLKNSAGVIIDTTMTDGTGMYMFGGLTPGDYSVQFEVPAGYDMVSPHNVGNDATDSDADPAMMLMSHVTNLESGEYDDTLDAGFFKKAKLGDFVWHDLDADGQQDANEPGIPGATVHLKNSAGVIIDTTMTDGTGMYMFGGLTPGDYSVQFEVPAGYDMVSPHNVGNDATDSDADPAMMLMSHVTNLESGEYDDTLDAGFFKKAKLGDYVWFDSDQDGLQDADEQGVKDVTVKLIDGNDGVTVLDTMMTDANGMYMFGGLNPGNYKVMFVLPAGFDGFTTQNVGANDAIDSDADLVMGMTHVTTLISGGMDLTLDAGLIKNVVQNPRIDLEKLVARLEECDPTGGEGLTPGYWKQSHHFDDWRNFSPTDNYNAVFGVNDDPSLTLLGALSRGGGENEALGRHAVAAILNASHEHISYDWTVAQIIAAVQQAYATNNFEPLKNQLDAWNNQGADIKNGPGTGGDCDPVLGPSVDADTPAEALKVEIGDKVVFTYIVTNTGDVDLTNVVLSDDNATPGNPGDDFNPTPVLAGGFNVGDVDQDNVLDVGEAWRYTAMSMVVAGDYCNLGVVTAANVNNLSQTVTDNDPACWTTQVPPPPVNPQINIEKYVKRDSDPAADLGDDADSPTGPTIVLGDDVVFTYLVTNTGNVELSNVVVKDDNATPGNTADDFMPIPVLSGAYNVGDADLDNKLDVGETWKYMAALTTVAVGQYVNIGKVTGTAPNAAMVMDSDPAHYVVEEPTPVFEGLTPGFWKQKQHFKYWVGYTTGMKYETVFGVDIAGSNYTLLQALGLGGGGMNALMRHSTAALLNAANPNITYKYTVSQIIAMVQQAFASGDFETTKNLFEKQNELGGNINS